MSGAAAPRNDALYVYGVVPSDTPPGLFAGARGVDPSQPVLIVAVGAVAAVASAVSLDEFGTEEIVENLRVADWVAAKVRAHDHVLEAAVGRTTIVPFRFGAIYRGEEQVRAMLTERADLRETLERLSGSVELGVKGFLDGERFREVLAAERGLAGEEPQTGRAYMERRRLDRELADAAREFGAACAADSHARLAAAAEDARSNPPRQDESVAGALQMFLNGAYLVREADDSRFRASLAELAESRRKEGVSYELTGPWPPYNFVTEEEPR